MPTRFRLPTTTPAMFAAALALATLVLEGWCNGLCTP